MPGLCATGEGGAREAGHPTPVLVGGGGAGLNVDRRVGSAVVVGRRQDVHFCRVLESGQNFTEPQYLVRRSEQCRRVLVATTTKYVFFIAGSVQENCYRMLFQHTYARQRC